MKSLIFLTHCIGLSVYCASPGNHDLLLLLSDSTTETLETTFLTVAAKLGYDCKTEECSEDNSMNITDLCDLEKTLDYSNDYEVAVNFNVIHVDHMTVPILETLDSLDLFIEQYGVLDDHISCDENKNLTDPYKRDCNDTDFNRKAKLFKGSMEEHSALYSVFKAITDDSYKPLAKSIVVCSSYCGTDKISNIDVFCKFCNEDMICPEGTIAMIAATPKDVKHNCDNEVPVIFYDTLYIEPDHSNQGVFEYETSTTLAHWKTLSKVTIDYIVNNRKWQRVAIISDDSLLSTKMKNDQKEYFDSKDILYAMYDCTVMKEFVQVLEFIQKMLKEVKVPVIVVNIAQYNLDTLTQIAEKTGMANEDIIWVFPGYQAHEIKSFKYSSFIYLDHQWSAEEFVVKLHMESLGNEDRFRKAIKNHIPPENLRSAHIVNVPTSLLSLKTPYTSCVVRTNDFYHPCADLYILYMVVALLLFLILMFVFLVLHNHIRMNTLAYKPLNRPVPMRRRLFQREPTAQARSFQMQPLR